jgi:hypothetical protein
MPSVTIDGGVLAVPLEKDGKEEIHRYVDTLLDWRRLLDEPWVAIYMSERVSEALFEDGLYPLRDQLRELFANQGIVEYDVNTVAQVVDSLLQLTPSFETYFKIRDVLVDEVLTTPDVLRLCCGAAMQSDLARCVVLIAILRRHCMTPVRDHSLILRLAPRRVVNVQALIHDLDHDRDDLGNVPTPPELFKGDVLVCDDFRGLVECLDESTILVNSADEVALGTAIRIALYKSRLARHEEPDWEDVPSLRVGHRFHASLIRACADQPASFPPRVLRAIVETLEGGNLGAVHALRTGPGGGNPQQTRGKDKAMRRDVDREFHMHYWQCEDGTVELASVGVHNDFSIPE